MKLIEFTQVVDEEDIEEHSNIPDHIHTSLQSQGYKRLGRGMDQAAYNEPGNPTQVLKIFGTSYSAIGSKMSNSQKMFKIWAKFCDQSTNPFLPKFYDCKKFTVKGQAYLQMRQERLREIPEQLGEALERVSEWIEDGRNMDLYDYLYMNHPRAVIPVKNNLAKNIKDLPLFLKTMRALYHIGEKKKYCFDLHPGNFMQRANGEVVIVDPWTADD